MSSQPQDILGNSEALLSVKYMKNELTSAERETETYQINFHLYDNETLVCSSAIHFFLFVHFSLVVLYTEMMEQYNAACKPSRTNCQS